MAYLKIINPRPGIKTTEKLLKLIQERTTGITGKELSQTVNRPISMVQTCLKRLLSSKEIYAKKSKTSYNIIYYPRNN